LWERRFSGDPAIIGRSIQLSGRPVTVVGVMPASFALPLRAGPVAANPPDVWIPFAFAADQWQPRGRYLAAVARTKADVALDEARVQMRSIAADLAREFPAFDTGWTVQVVPIRDQLSGHLRPALLLLSGAVVFVLLIACANVASLLLTRAAARQREIAIRRALGASRARVVWELMADSVVLAVIGGAASLLVALWLLDSLVSISPVGLAALMPVSIDDRVLAFTGTIALATAVVAGLVPALEGSRTDVQDALESGARQVGVNIRHRRLRQTLVVGEIAIAVVLLVGAGLTLSTLARVRGTNPGFSADHVLTGRVALPDSKYPEGEARTRFFQEVQRRLSALPGVQSVGTISFLPLSGGGAGTGFSIVGQPAPAPGQGPVTDVRVVDNGFFSAMRIPLTRGRLFTGRELSSPAHVVVVNEELARLHFPGRDPIGERLMINMADPVVPTEIVGVVGDVRYASLEVPARPTVYWPHPQLSYNAMTVVIRAASDAASLGPAMQREIMSVDGDQPLSQVRTMEQLVARAVSERRFTALLLSVFAALALMLAAVGLYGVMSYVVSQRTSEIGLRLALGANAGDVVRMVVVNAVWLTMLGLAIGVSAAVVLSLTAARLVSVGSVDPLTLAGVAALLAGVATLASYLPARRAARIEPVQALRYQ
jgi:putative ABC transport system permease protein